MALWLDMMLVAVSVGQSVDAKAYKLAVEMVGTTVNALVALLAVSSVGRMVGMENWMVGKMVW